METLRKAFGKNPRYVVVSIDETINALSKSRQRDDVARVTKAELMITLRGTSVRGDSVTWTATAWDLGAHTSHEQRSVSAGRVPLAASAASTDSLYRAVSKALEQLDRAPRRQP